MAPGWTAFLTFVGLLTVGVLLLARRSQDLLTGEAGGGVVPSRDDRGSSRTAGEIRDDDGVTVDAGATASGPEAGRASDSPSEPSRESVADPRSETAAEAAAGGAAGHPGGPDSRAPEPPGEPTTETVAPEGRHPAVGADREAHGEIGGPGSLDGLDLSTGTLLANVALTQGLLVLLVVGAAWTTEIPAAAFGIETTPESLGLPALSVGVGFGLALYLANEGGARVADAMGVGYDERLRAALAPDSAAGWLLLLGGILPVVAIAEEVLFRGALVGAASVGLGASPWLLAVVSSVAFALGHGAQGRAGIAVTGLLGFVLAAGFVVTGSLLVVIVAHYLVNALEFVVNEGFELSPPGEDASA